MKKNGLKGGSKENILGLKGGHQKILKILL